MTPSLNRKACSRTVQHKGLGIWRARAFYTVQEFACDSFAKRSSEVEPTDIHRGSFSPLEPRASVSQKILLTGRPAGRQKMKVSKCPAHANGWGLGAKPRARVSELKPAGASGRPGNRQTDRQTDRQSDRKTKINDCARQSLLWPRCPIKLQPDGKT
jgi:hypothetical protein